MPLEAEVWVEMVTEGGRGVVAAWRKSDVDAARHRQESFYRTLKLITCEATHLA